jgi:hypothetical protein
MTRCTLTLTQNKKMVAKKGVASTDTCDETQAGEEVQDLAGA